MTVDMQKKFFRKSDKWKLKFGKKAKRYFFWRDLLVSPVVLLLSIFFKRFRTYEFKQPFAGYIEGELVGNLYNSTSINSRPVSVTGRLVNNWQIDFVAKAREVFNLAGKVKEIRGDVAIVHQWAASDVVEISGDLCVYPSGTVTKKIKCRNLFIWGPLNTSSVEVDVTENIYLMDSMVKIDGVYGRYLYAYGTSKVDGVLETRAERDKKKAAAKP